MHRQRILFDCLVHSHKLALSCYSLIIDLKKKNHNYILDLYTQVTRYIKTDLPLFSGVVKPVNGLVLGGKMEGIVVYGAGLFHLKDARARSTLTETSEHQILLC